ncbi:hypothetical protein DL768_010309 [Monosporascus sp. mg162]|nr:hypothetical protein DL768_010309 [Monosporascus sp. mg162]
MQIASLFLYIIFCSEASAAGPLRRGDRWRRQDVAGAPSLYQTASTPALTNEASWTTSSTPSLTPSSTEILSSESSSAETASEQPKPETAPEVITTSVPDSAISAEGTDETTPVTGVPSSVDSGTIPTFDFYPSSTVPVGSIVSPTSTADTATATSSSAAVPSPSTSSSAKSDSESSIIPIFDFFPSSTVPASSAADLTSTAAAVTSSSAAVPSPSAPAPAPEKPGQDSSTIPTFDFYPSSTVPADSIVDPTSTAVAATSSIAVVSSSSATQDSATLPTFDFYSSATGPNNPEQGTSTIPTFDFHPSSTVAASPTVDPTSSAVTVTSSAVVVSSSAVASDPSATETSKPKQETSEIPTFDFFPSSTVPLGPTADPTSTADVATTSSTMSGSATTSKLPESSTRSSASGAESEPATNDPAYIQTSDTSVPSATVTPSSAVESTDTPQQVTTTSNPEKQIPTVITSLPPTSTTVAPDVYESNLAEARRYNELFSAIDEQSSCTSGQVACVQGNIGRCSAAGSWNITPCGGTLACSALPMNTTTGVQVGCFDKSAAERILGGGAGGGGSDVTVTVRPTETITSQVTVTEGQPTETSTSVATQTPTTLYVTETVSNTVEYTQTIEYTTTVSVTVVPSSTAEAEPSDSTTAPSVEHIVDSYHVHRGPVALNHRGSGGDADHASRDPHRPGHERAVLAVTTVTATIEMIGTVEFGFHGPQDGAARYPEFGN